MTDHRDVAAEVAVAAPIDAVWRALRDPAQLRRWHGWEFDGLDAEIDAVYRRGAVEERATGPDRRLRTGGGGTVFEVRERDGATVVTVLLVLPPDDPAWHGWYDQVRSSWLTFAQQLRFALERHPGEDRRTSSVSGTRPGGAAGPIELAGLAGLGDQGSPYAVRLPSGDDVAGEVWFRAPGQLGVTVAGWGDALLVVADEPPGAVLSTYGRDPGEPGRRWETWWGGHFPPA